MTKFANRKGYRNSPGGARDSGWDPGLNHVKSPDTTRRYLPRKYGELVLDARTENVRHPAEGKGDVAGERVSQVQFSALKPEHRLAGAQSKTVGRDVGAIIRSEAQYAEFALGVGDEVLWDFGYGWEETVGGECIAPSGEVGELDVERGLRSMKNEWSYG